MIRRESLVFYNKHFKANQKDAFFLERKKDIFTEGEIDILWNKLDNALARAKPKARYNPHTRSATEKLSNAFGILLSAEQHPRNLNPMRSFFEGTLGKQVMDFLVYNQQDNPEEIAQALKTLWLNDKLNTVTMYLFTEMVRNHEPIPRAVEVINRFGQHSEKKEWELRPREKHLSWLKKDIDAYFNEPEAFIKKVEKAIQEDRKRGELHRAAADKNNSYNYSINYYDYWMGTKYSERLWSVDYQDIDGKTPLHYAIERADAEGLKLANVMLVNKLGYGTASIKDDAGKTPRDLAKEIKDEAMQAKFNELFEVADQRQRLQLAGEEIYKHVGRYSEKGKKIEKVMHQIRNVTTMKELNTHQEALKKACAQRQTFNFSIFEKFRAVPKSLQILNRALEDKPVSIHREELGKAPTNKAGG